jgi:ABC-2 type transport system ATP-binding protein
VHDDEPLLVADGARIAVDDVVAMDRLTFRSQGERVLLVGDAAPLFAAIAGTSLAWRGGGRAPPSYLDRSGASGECSVVAGKLSCAGADVGAGQHWTRIGAAPLDPMLPADWSVLDYVMWSARLAGSPRKLARDQAHHAIELIHLTAFTRSAVNRLPLAVRRAAVLAQAVVTSPRVLLADSPLRGLDGPAVGFVLGALAAATDGRGAIVTQERSDLAAPGGALADGATSILAFARGELVLDADDSLALARTYRVTVQANATALGDELAHAGLSLRGGPHHFTVTLPVEVDTRAIFAAASAANAPIAELIRV